MRRIVVAVVAALLFAGVTVAQNEPTPGMSPDAQQMLNGGPREPGPSAQRPGEFQSSGDTAGMTTHHSETSSSSSTSTVTVGKPSADQADSSGNSVMGLLFGGHRAHANGGGTACSAPSVGMCGGCSVACPAGKSAQCRAGSMGSMTMICPTDSMCKCKG